MNRFRLNPRARHWLRSPSPGEAPGGSAAPEGSAGDQGEGDWDVWVLGRMAAGAFLDVGGILVDLAVLDQRFECVSERCAPRTGRGRLRSCCADLDVALIGAEINRLRRHTRRLHLWLARREPRIADLPKEEEGRPFWLADDCAHLTRPGGRCVFSAMDRRGRIRCHLHRYAKAHDLERQAVQPLPCRLFPLILVELPTGGVALTTLHRRTTRLVGTFPVSRFPCLSDPTHGPLRRALAKDLDWLFGKGFARELRL